MLDRLRKKPLRFVGLQRIKLKDVSAQLKFGEFVHHNTASSLEIHLEGNPLCEQAVRDLNDQMQRRAPNIKLETRVRQYKWFGSGVGSGGGKSRCIAGPPCAEALEYEKRQEERKDAAAEKFGQGK